MSRLSDHYQGERGRDYFVWQRRLGLGGGHIEARKFSRWVRPADRVLDFGCGSGAMLAALSCSSRLGVDVNPAARAAASERGVEVHAAIGEVEPESVDAVVSNHALEHTLDPFSALVDLKRVLVPGGRLALCLPFDALGVRSHYSVRDRHHHLYTWNPQTIGNLLLEAGFVNVEAWSFTHAWPPGWAWLDSHLPLRAFDAACAVWAVVSRQRQVMAFATKPVVPMGGSAGPV